MTIDELLQEARTTWGDTPMTLAHIAVALGVVHGDISRQARSQIERGTIEEQALKKELGNLITSSIRWCDDLGFDPKECIQLSQAAQRQYKKSS